MGGGGVQRDGIQFSKSVESVGYIFCDGKKWGGGGIILALAYVFMQDGGFNLNY